MSSETKTNSRDPRNRPFDGFKTESKRCNLGQESTLAFQDVDFVVPSNGGMKKILSGVSGEVKSSDVLAIMGPSGAGKSTLISTLTLDGLYGVPSGYVTLNGVPMTAETFKSHCYVVEQYDKHWDFLTCRETLIYAAALYNVNDDSVVREMIVDDVIDKMGLGICAGTRNARLSGGQRRRLSIGVGLLKNPVALFLDEPTSGLDSASAQAIMQEMVRVAKENNIIIVCTIHQPSTKVYNDFDKVMIMARGREAYSGDVQDAIPYFDSIGHECPPATNPTEYFLDLVNADFSDELLVDGILYHWQRTKEQEIDNPEQKSPEQYVKPTSFNPLVAPSYLESFKIMLHRHFTLIYRHPVLYVGRLLLFLVTNTLFAIVYWRAREMHQDQTVNKVWISQWFISVPSNMAVVAVHVLNDEFKSIRREARNGMVPGLSYVLAKTLLVAPLFFLFSLFALGIPAYAIQGIAVQTAGIIAVLFASTMYLFESAAEAFSVWFEDPITGMLVFTMFWFASFLFGGFLISIDEMFWPFKAFVHVMPYSYYLRSYSFVTFSKMTFEACVDPTTSAVCVNSTAGIDVLGQVSKILPVLETTDSTVQDILITLGIGTIFKIAYVIGVLYKISRVSTIQEPQPLMSTKTPNADPVDGHHQGAVAHEYDV